MPQVGAADAWDITTGVPDSGGESIIVAVLDTGVDLDHPDLDRNLLTDTLGNVVGGSFLDSNYVGFSSAGKGGNPGKLGGGGSGGSSPQDDHGHGTHVAGIIAAEINNLSDLAAEAADDSWSGGTVGVVPDAKIMPVKVLNSYGSGSTSGVAEGIYFAAENGADIINMSLGGGFSQTMSDAIYDAYFTYDVLVIASPATAT